MHFATKFILLNQKERGFTIIELLTVVVIIGILAAISIPNLLSQIGKARETEAKVNLGSIAHAQQAYHFESNSFYNNSDIYTFTAVSLSGEYYAFTGDDTADSTKAIHTAYAIDPDDSGARDFAIGIYFDAPRYSQILCIANGIDNDGTTSSVTAKIDGTCDRGKRIK